jgi:hypothetical protein
VVNLKTEECKETKYLTAHAIRDYNIISEHPPVRVIAKE